MAQVSVGRYNLRTWGEAGRFLPQPGFQVYAERGVAWLEMPDKIQWSDASGLHDERLALEPSVGESLNLELHRLVQGEPSMGPTWDDARRAALLVADLKKSQNEGRTIWSQTESG